MYQPDSGPHIGGPALERGQKVSGVQFKGELTLKRGENAGVLAKCLTLVSGITTKLCLYIVNNKPGIGCLLDLIYQGKELLGVFVWSFVGPETPR